MGFISCGTSLAPTLPPVKAVPQTYWLTSLQLESRQIAVVQLLVSGPEEQSVRTQVRVWVPWPAVQGAEQALQLVQLSTHATVTGTESLKETPTWLHMSV